MPSIAWGNLCAAKAGNNTIVKFTISGVPSLFASSGLSEPFGLAFDSVGNLYAANIGNHTIQKFTPGGVGSVFADASDGLSYPTFPAFTDNAVVPLKLVNQVPEPSTWALLGFGLSRPRRVAPGASGRRYAWCEGRRAPL